MEFIGETGKRERERERERERVKEKNKISSGEMENKGLEERKVRE